MKQKFKDHRDPSAEMEEDVGFGERHRVPTVGTIDLSTNPSSHDDSSIVSCFTYTTVLEDNSPGPQLFQGGTIRNGGVVAPTHQPVSNLWPPIAESNIEGEVVQPPFENDLPFSTPNLQPVAESIINEGEVVQPLFDDDMSLATPRNCHAACPPEPMEASHGMREDATKDDDKYSTGNSLLSNNDMHRDIQPSLECNELPSNPSFGREVDEDQREESFEVTKQKYFEMLKDQVKQFGYYHEDIATTYSKIGHLYLNELRYDEAMEQFKNSEKVLLELEVLGEPKHQEVAKSYNYQAIVLKKQSQYEEAIEMHLKALCIQNSSWDNIEMMLDASDTYSYMALILDEQCKHEESIEMFERRLSILSDIFGRNSKQCSQCCYDIGYFLKLQGKSNEALKMYQEVLKIQKNIGNDTDSLAANAYKGFGGVYRQQDRVEKAIRMYEKALEILMKTRGDESLALEVADTRIEIAKLHIRSAEELLSSTQYRCRKALQLGHEAIQTQLNILGDNSPEVAETICTLQEALSLSGQGDSEEFNEHANASFAIQTEAVNDNDPEAARKYLAIGKFFGLHNRYHQAQLANEMALKATQQLLGYDHSEVASVLGLIANSCLRQGNLNEAIKCHKKQLRIELECFGSDHLDVSQTYANIGALLKRRSHYHLKFHEYCMAATDPSTDREDALDMFLLALDIRMVALAPYDSKAYHICQSVLELLVQRGTYDDRASAAFQKIPFRVTKWLNVLALRLKTLGVVIDDHGSIFVLHTTYFLLLFIPLFRYITLPILIFELQMYQENWQAWWPIFLFRWILPVVAVGLFGNEVLSEIVFAIFKYIPILDRLLL